MAVYTPKGLKIRWDVSSAFSLIARLYPKRSAKDVFRLTEALDVFPTAVTLITGIVCFFMKLDIVKIAAIAAIARVLSYSLIHWNVMLPIVPLVGRIYNRTINWLILPWLIPIVLGISLMSWKAVAGYYVGVIIGWVIEYTMIIARGRKMYSQFGLAFTQSEFAFVMAYRYFASKDGKTLDIIDHDGNESEMEYWADAYNDYAKTYPYLAAKIVQGM